MNRFTARTLFIFTLAISPCLAAQNPCGEKFGYPDEACLCGSPLENLTVATPAGMVLEAVCGLAEANLGPIRPIDLAQEKVSLDTFTPSGGYYWGIIYFAGTLEVTGKLDFAPSDAGFWWFQPGTSLAPGEKSVFADNYIALLLDKELPLETPDLPAELAPPPGFYPCLRTPMKIRFDRLEVELSERGGAYVHGLELLAPFEFEKIGC